MTLRFVLLMLLLLRVAYSVSSDDKPVWLPVTGTDWSISQDSAKGIRDAVMIFEKLVEDDKKFNDNKFRLKTYRRIKILSPRGRQWADVSLPYDPEESEIKSVAGRTMLPDGRVIDLSPEKILEKEVVKVGDERIREKFFSLPGVTDSCIIEYVYEYENKRVNPLWVAQKEIPLIEGEYRWKFFHGEISAANPFLAWILGSRSVPNYLSVNDMKKMKIEMLPNADAPEEVVFRFNDLLAFEPEPFSIPDEAAKTHLRLYYGGAEHEISFWSIESAQMSQVIGLFIKEHEKVKELVDNNFSSLPSIPIKIDSAFYWVQRNIKRITYEEYLRDRDKIETVDDILKYRKALQPQIAFLFFAMLKDMGASAGMVYAINKEKHLFYDVAKYWQFDQPLVFVNDFNMHSTFYSPADKFLKPGQVPWYFETTRGLTIGAPVGTPLFARFEKTPADMNAIRRVIRLEIPRDEPARSTIVETYTGHPAEQLKILLQDKQDRERSEILKKQILDNLSTEWRDSVAILDFRGGEDSLVLTYALQGPTTELSGGRIIFSPHSLFGKMQNPFTSQTRLHPIMFKYATLQSYEFTITTPPGMVLENVPEPLYFANDVGDVQEHVNFSGDSISVSSKYALRETIFSEDFYTNVKDLFQRRQALGDFVLVMKKQADEHKTPKTKKK
ncbi:MAG TPA: DUF3857 domain-containing protein [Bacteroidota bacterium]|nr:DUF3857 domain-containing protein [Bacteroidota bacterium]